MKRRHRVLLILLVAVVILGLVLDAFAIGTPTPTDDGDGDGDEWTWPLDPRPEVIDGFDPPDDPYGAGHRGVDLVGRVGQPVLAVADGRVGFVGVIAGRGVVVVDHGAERSTYEPVIGEVRVDQRVSAGDRLGRLELVGSHCWPRACLHLGRVAGQTYRDPLELLGGGGPIRLLPFHAADAGSRDLGSRDLGALDAAPPGVRRLDAWSTPPRIGPSTPDGESGDVQLAAAIQDALAMLVREFG